jgi:hypothetical protein
MSDRIKSVMFFVLSAVWISFAVTIISISNGR